MIGNRLKLIRSARGLSLRALAGQIGNRVTAQAIGRYERNESMPSSGILIALAQALGVSVGYLTGDQEMELGGIEFRKKGILGKREEAQVAAQVLHLLEHYLAVEELLDLPSVQWDKPRAAPFPIVSELSEAGRAAQSLRQHWGLGDDPIPNLVELLEERGLKVMALDLGNIDGLAAWVRRPRRQDAPVAVVNRNECGDRQRFTLAHELGHIVMQVAAKVNEEQAAHRFAGAFLMPAEAMWTEVGKHRTAINGEELISLKKRFGVSMQAIAHRCKDLGIFNQALFKKLADQFKRQGWSSPPYCEPEAMTGEEPARFKRLTYRALSEGAISESRAAELLGIGVRELDRQVAAWSTTAYPAVAQ